MPRPDTVHTVEALLRRFRRLRPSTLEVLAEFEHGITSTDTAEALAVLVAAGCVRRERLPCLAATVEADFVTRCEAA